MVRDNLSRFPAAEVVKSTAAKDVIPAIDQIYTDYGTPLSHKTDSGPPFNSTSFATYSKKNNIEHIVTPPLHPRSNEAECMMKPLGKTMKLAHHNNLDKKQELVVRKFIKDYKTTPHPSTGMAPGDVILRAGYNTGKPRAPPPDDIVNKVKLADADSKQKNKSYTNNKRFTSRRKLLQGQQVLLKNDQRTRKFEPYYEKEAYFIIDLKGELLSLRRQSDGRTVKQHMSAVKPFYQRTPRQIAPSKKMIEDEDDEYDDISQVTPTPEKRGETERPLNDTNHNNVIQPILPPPPVPQIEPRRSDRIRTSTYTTINRDFVE